MVAYYPTKIAVSTATAKQRNLKTMQHSKDDSAACAWHEYRRLHITSSNVGMIAKRPPTTKAVKFYCIQSSMVIMRQHRISVRRKLQLCNEYIQWKANNGPPRVTQLTQSVS